MKGNKLPILLAICVLLIATLACAGGSVSTTTANIANAHMASDVDDTNQTSVFSPSDTGFYCFFDLKNAPDDTAVKGVWTLVQAEGYTSNAVIDEATLTSGSDSIYFSLERGADPWPVGQYKIDLYINDKLMQTINFEVR